MNHSIKVVARRTGLSPHVIRVWERRYQAVKPDRTETNRRLYDEEEIDRLRLLQKVTHAGHPISQVARLSTSELRALVEEELGRQTESPSSTGSPAALATEAAPAEGAPEQIMSEAMVAVRDLDAERLERLLTRAAVAFGQATLLQHIIAPLIQQVGDQWREGRLKVAHEHVATAVLRTLLGNFARPHSRSDSTPILLATTPSGQIHELGALLVAAAASVHGWRVTYLGPSLPAEEIAGAALQHRVRAVALSLVYPEDDPLLPGELMRLRSLIPSGIALLVGGRAATAYEPTLRHVGASLIANIPQLYNRLDDLRREPAAAKNAHN